MDIDAFLAATREKSQVSKFGISVEVSNAVLAQDFFALHLLLNEMGHQNIRSLQSAEEELANRYVPLLQSSIKEGYNMQLDAARGMVRDFEHEIAGVIQEKVKTKRA